ncbi:MAG: hypothetical protein IJ801_02155 [Lachnospiraceae bacterium]|nr:hypothetical protein [Lachnospiraceae bacterium]
MDVNSVVDMQCYTLNLETLQKELADSCTQNSDFYFINTGQKAKYTKEDEAYLFQFQQGYDGIPLCRYQLADTLKKQNLGYGLYADCSAYYSSQGLISLWAGNLMDVQQAGELHPIVPLSDILDKSIPTLSQMASGETTIEIKEISLCYVPVLQNVTDLEFRAVPVWVIAYFQSNPFLGEEGTLLTTDQYDVFDAITGERMY